MIPTIEGSSGIRKASDGRRVDQPQDERRRRCIRDQADDARDRSSRSSQAAREPGDAATTLRRPSRRATATRRDPTSPRARSSRTGASRTSSDDASTHAAIAIASPMPGSPSGPTQDDRQGRVDDDRDDRRGDRRPRVLLGVEGAGQHGDQRVRGQPDQQRSERRRRQLDGRRRDLAVCRTGASTTSLRRTIAEPGDRDHHEDEQPERPR